MCCSVYGQTVGKWAPEMRPSPSPMKECVLQMEEVNVSAEDAAPSFQLFFIHSMCFMAIFLSTCFLSYLGTFCLIWGHTASGLGVLFEIA